MTAQDHTSHIPTDHSGLLALPSLPTRQCRLWHSLLSPFFARLDHGRVEITLPSGGHLIYGKSEQDAPVAHVTVHRHRTLWRILTRGPLGLAESFLDSCWSCDDLTTLFNICLSNRSIFEAIRARGTLAHWAARLKHLMRSNSIRGSKRNIAYHYDLGNDFYSQWLDETMTYSSAYRLTEDDNLEAAQKRKLDRALAMSRADPGDNILEIGCGWGAFAERAAGAGCRVDGLTLSKEQLAYSLARARRKGFEDRAQFHLRDYRHEAGTYDAIVSIEMIEAVGEDNWPTYFASLYNNLRAGGHAALQAITIAEDQYDRYRRNADFIQTYIFPGGMLPTHSLMISHAQKAGLELCEHENFGKDYARTLALWRQRFLAKWPQIRTLGYDERFRRMWLYYLAYCEAGFTNGTINVGLYSFKRA